MFILSALLLGLAGSLHCVLMCGPIALALPLSQAERSMVLLKTLLYNFGRITTYIFMGLVFGLMGWGIALAGYQSAISISLGVLLILMVLFSITIEKRINKFPIINKGVGQLKKLIAKTFKRNTLLANYKLGLLNGLIPCGLVYVALAGALASGGVFEGALYMFFFGLGTLPLMAAVMLLRKRFIKANLFRRLSPYLTILVGILFIYRGIVVDNSAAVSKNEIISKKESPRIDSKEADYTLPFSEKIK